MSTTANHGCLNITVAQRNDLTRMQQMCCMIAPLLQTMAPRLIYFLLLRERRSEDLFKAQGSKKGTLMGPRRQKKKH